MAVLNDDDATFGAAAGVILGIPAITVFGMGLVYVSIGDMPVFSEQSFVLAAALGLMLGTYLGGLFGLTYVYEGGKAEERRVQRELRRRREA